MNDNVTVLPQQTFRSLNVGDIKRNTGEHKRKAFGANIKFKLSNYLSPPKYPIEEQDMYADYTKEVEPIIPEDDYFEWYNEYISSEVLLSQDVEHMRSDKVTSRGKGDMGNVTGVNNSNRILDTCVYDVMS